MAAALLAEIELANGNDEEAGRLAAKAREGSNAEAAAQGALTLALVNDPESSENRSLLEQAMASEDQHCRSVAAYALSDLETEGSPRERELLEEAMKTPDSQIRAAAALDLALCVGADDGREQLLLEALGSNEDEIRDRATLQLAIHLHNKGRVRAVRQE